MIDHLALVIGDIIKQQQLLADIEVMRLDLTLRVFDLPCQQTAFDDLALLHAGDLQQTLGAIGITKDAHQRVFHRQIEAAGTRVTLTARTTAQLVVDAPRLVPLGTDDVQATGCQHRIVALLPGGAQLGMTGFVDGLAGSSQLGQLGIEIATQLNIGTATGHVGSDGHGAGTACLRHHLRFAIVLLGVEHFVSHALLAQQPGEKFRRFDGCGAHQRRLTARGAIADVFDDGRVFVVLGQIDKVLHVAAHHRAVRRDDHDLEAIDLQELRGFGIGRAGHARELFVEAEEVLESDRRDGLVFLADAHTLFGLDRLMQAIGPAAAGHGAAGELVDDDDLTVANDVFDITPVQRMGAQRRIEVMHQADVGRVVQAFALAQHAALGHQALDALMAFFGDVHLLGFFIDRIVAGAVLDFLTAQLRHQQVDALIQLGALFGRTGDDQRSAGLINEDRINLVDDGVAEATLHALFKAEGQVVAQVIEAELVIGAIGDVAGIGRALFFRIL